MSEQPDQRETVRELQRECNRLRRERNRAHMMIRRLKYMRSLEGVKIACEAFVGLTKEES